MKPGRPKTSSAKPARQSRAKKSAVVVDPSLTKEGRPRRANQNDLPPRSPKSSLLTTLTSDPRLTEEDRAAIESAHEQGMTLADLAALTAYEIRMARVFLQSQELAPKDFIVAIGKAASHVAAAAQLGQANAPTGANISVTFNGTGLTSTRPEAVQRTGRDEQVGDLVDTEG